MKYVYVIMAFSAEQYDVLTWPHLVFMREEDAKKYLEGKDPNEVYDKDENDSGYMISNYFDKVQLVNA